MGRAFGLFLFVVGVALAACGLPKSNWLSHPATLPAPALVTAEPVSSRPVEPPRRTLSPMEKLRSAAQSARSGGRLEDAPRDVPVMDNSVIKAPTILEAAKRELGVASKIETSVQPGPAARSAAIMNAAKLSSQVLANRTDKSATASVAVMAAPATAPAKAQAPFQNKTTAQAAVEAVSSLASAAGPKPELAPPGSSVKLAQRYAPPVYLGRTDEERAKPQRGFERRRGFNTREFWDGTRRSGS